MLCILYKAFLLFCNKIYQKYLEKHLISNSFKRKKSQNEEYKARNVIKQAWVNHTSCKEVKGCLLPKEALWSGLCHILQQSFVINHHNSLEVKWNSHILLGYFRNKRKKTHHLFSPVPNLAFSLLHNTNRYQRKRQPEEENNNNGLSRNI